MTTNNDWITLPVFLFGYYPKHVIEKAKKIHSPSDTNEYFEKLVIQIAESEKVDPGVYVKRAFPRDKMDLLETVQEYPDDRSKSTLQFEARFYNDDCFYLIDIPYHKLLNKIHKFLLTEPSYRIESSETEEVVDEMGTEVDETGTEDMND